MNTLVKQGHPTFLACRHNSAMLEPDRISAQITTFPLPFRNEIDLLTAWQIAKIVKKHEIDILHAHTAHAHTMAWLARKFAGRGKVLVSRRVDFAPKQKWINKIKYDSPDHYIAISRKIAEIISEFGIPEEKISVVYSAIEPKRFEVEGLRRDALPSSVDGPLLGNVAALVGHKDQQTLIRSMALVLKEIPDARLVIAGEGPLRQMLESLIVSLGLSEYVYLLGHRNDIPALLNTLDVFIMSSKEEGLCTSILDAMAAGTPVAATAGGGIPEIVRSEQTGLLAPIGDHAALAKNIVRLLNDPSLCSSLKTNATHMLHESFTLEKMVSGNLAVYEQLAGKSHQN